MTVDEVGGFSDLLFTGTVSARLLKVTIRIVCITFDLSLFLPTKLTQTTASTPPTTSFCQPFAMLPCNVMLGNTYAQRAIFINSVLKFNKHFASHTRTHKYAHANVP